MIQNTHYVNNTPSDIRMVFPLPLLKQAYVTGLLPEELEDLFTIRFVDGVNHDGTRRMIIEAA